MSTTVSYKGQTLTTVSNDTKTLLTEGKYLEDDLTLTDVSGGGSTLGTKSVTANGTYTATDDSLDGYSQVTVAVPASAVDSGTKSISITSNGTTTEDVTGYASASITANVPNSYEAGDEGKVVSSGALASQTSTTKNANGTYDTTLNNEVVISVPNSYSAGDEGKVVSNGALVAQTSQNITENGTYDTTLKNSVTVNVSGGGGSSVIKWKASRASMPTFTGIYDATGIELDFNNTAMNVSSCSYLAFKNTTDGTITFKNISSSATGSQMNCGDFLRSSPCVKSIDFGGLAPAGTTRWFQGWGSSQDGNFHNGGVTITNFCLDNLSSNNDSFGAGASSRYYHNFDIYFTGTLKNNMSISNWGMLNADSWNRMIECLYDYSGGTAHTLTVGSTILAMIDSAHQTIAANRGWTLA